MILLDLFLGFLRVGLFSFGGAYGAIPLIRDVVFSYHWLDEEALSYMIAVSESTPGPIMVNMATYIGSTQAGFFGALLATFAVVLPAFLIILLIMVVMKSILKNPWVQAVLGGLKPCVIGIVLSTGIILILNNLFSGSFTIRSSFVPDGRVLLLSVFIAAILYGSKPLLKKKVSPIPLILISAVLGILVYGV